MIIGLTPQPWLGMPSAINQGWQPADVKTGRDGYRGKNVQPDQACRPSFAVGLPTQFPIREM